MKKLEIVNKEVLSKEELEKAEKLLNETHIKIERMLNNEVALFLFIKEYNTEGKRKRYSLELDVKSETQHFKAEAMDWDFPKTLHQVIDKIKQEIEHKFHISNQK